MDRGLNNLSIYCRIPTMHCGIALCLRYDVFTGYLQDVDVFLHH